MLRGVARRDDLSKSSPLEDTGSRVPDLSMSGIQILISLVDGWMDGRSIHRPENVDSTSTERGRE